MNDKKDLSCQRENRYNTRDQESNFGPCDIIKSTFPIRIDKNTARLKGFPQEVRNIICKLIYKSFIEQSLDFEILENIIEELRSENRSKDWIQEIPEKALKKISIMLNDPNFEHILKKYFKDLVKIVKVFKILNDRYLQLPKPANIRKVVKKLRENDITLYMTQESLEITLRHIFDYLKEQLKNYKIERIKEQKLFIDKESSTKECGRCHRILAYDKFEIYKSQKRKGYRSTCRKCRTEIRLINDLNTKFRLLNDYFEPSCCECDVNLIEILPASSFHHPKDKTYTWSEGREKFHDADCIATRLKEDGALQMCENCHRIKTAIIFQKYKDLILLSSLFEHSAMEILEIVESQINRISADKKSYHRRNIKRFIKKRYVFEELFNGKCVGCGKVTVNSNLPALDGHHLKKVDDKSLWKEIADLDCEDILKIYIKEGIISLCANCHRIIHSVFHDYIEEIFKDHYLESKLQNFKCIVKENFNQIMKNINNFQFDLEVINFNSPLKVNEFASRDAWKLRLIQMYYGIKKLNIKSFRRKDFEQFKHINIRNITEWIPKFQNKALIEIAKPITSQYKYYRFTDEGIEIVKKIEKEYIGESKEEQELIYLYITQPIIRPLRNRVFVKYYVNPYLSFNEFYSKFFIIESRKRINWYWNEAKKWFSNIEENKILKK